MSINSYKINKIIKAETCLYKLFICSRTVCVYNIIQRQRQKFNARAKLNIIDKTCFFFNLNEIKRVRVLI